MNVLMVLLLVLIISAVILAGTITREIITGLYLTIMGLLKRNRKSGSAE